MIVYQKRKHILFFQEQSRYFDFYTKRSFALFQKFVHTNAYASFFADIRKKHHCIVAQTAQKRKRQNPLTVIEKKVCTSTFDKQLCFCIPPNCYLMNVLIALKIVQMTYNWMKLFLMFHLKSYIMSKSNYEKIFRS